MNQIKLHEIEMKFKKVTACIEGFNFDVLLTNVVNHVKKESHRTCRCYSVEDVLNIQFKKLIRCEKLDFEYK